MTLTFQDHYRGVLAKNGIIVDETDLQIRSAFTK